MKIVWNSLRFCMLILLPALVIPVKTWAAGMEFQLDTLLLSANASGNGVFTVTSSAKETLYLEASVVKITMNNGEIEKVPLTRDNFPLWDVAVNPTKLVMRPGESKPVAVKYLCQSNCAREEDSVYQVRFTPALEDSGGDNQQDVQFRFGLAPYYVIPALEQNVDYSWEYDEEKQEVAIHNTGNTMVKVEFDNCNNLDGMRTTSCRAVYPILAGRYKKIELPEGLHGNNVQVKVANHDQSIERNFTL